MTVMNIQQLSIPNHVKRPKGSRFPETSPLKSFIAAGLITPNSEITLRNVGINETRDGILRGQEYGSQYSPVQCPYGRTTRTGSRPHYKIFAWKGPEHTDRRGADPDTDRRTAGYSRHGSLAEGKTEIQDASELRVKERTASRQ